MFKKSLKRILLTTLLTGFLGVAAGADETVILISDLEPGDLRSAAFTVDRPLDVHVTAVGAETESGDAMFAYPWIIDAHTRTLVWSMDEEFTKPVKKSAWLRHYDDEISLRAGVYELFFHAGRPSFASGDFHFDGLRELLEALGKSLGENKKDRNDRPSARELARKFYVRVAGDRAALRTVERPTLPEPAIRLVQPDNDAYLSQGFALTKDLDLNIYAIGEYSEWDDAMVDWGWIINAETRERVWEMERANTDWAGGAEKNRRFQGRQHFPRGNYIAFYVTDDSHTHHDWNANPPYDPKAWGLQIFPADSADRDQIEPYRDSYEESSILRLTGVGDNELLSEAFRVNKLSRPRIYAIGEYDRFSDRMVDYAWIVHADNNQKVWAMKGDESEPAGGAGKNRLFDGVLTLEPGDYVLYYASDGSHSYGDGWNAAPPYDQKSYGVTIFPADQESRATVVAIDQRQIPRPDVLAEITGVRDNQERSARFSLTSPTRLTIYAVGEGTRHGMADYGWIEDERTGDIVWEMTYRKTSHAGGADKNREVNQTILLDKGEYVVHYITDDSHATGDWNADPPDDPASWGIVLTKAERAEH